MIAVSAIMKPFTKMHPMLKRLSHRAARSCSLEGAASGAVDKSAQPQKLPTKKQKGGIYRPIVTEGITI